MASRHTTARAPLGTAVIVLAAGTAAIHIYLGLSGLPLFVLNGLGYLTLVAALHLPISQLARYTSVVRWALICYTTLTIFLWVIVGARTPIGYADKLVEVALISLLLIEDRRERSG